MFSRIYAHKPLAFIFALLVVLLIPRGAALETDVQCGKSPKFADKTSGRFTATVIGHYTDRPGRVAAGVDSFTFQSDKPAKRIAELLALRTAFLECFVEEWVHQGGRREDAIYQIRNYWGRCDGPTR